MRPISNSLNYISEIITTTTQHAYNGAINLASRVYEAATSTFNNIAQSRPPAAPPPLSSEVTLEAPTEAKNQRIINLINRHTPLIQYNEESPADFIRRAANTLKQKQTSKINEFLPNYSPSYSNDIDFFNNYLKTEEQYSLLFIINATDTGKQFINDNKDISLTALSKQIQEQIGDLNSDLYRDLKQITSLNLSDTKITSLPTEIGLLTNLRELDIQFTKITSLPTEIGMLTNLESLKLDRTPLTSLPTEIGHLINLRELDIQCTKITSLPPEIGKLTKLTTLDLSYTEITSLPPEIGLLTNLTTLELRGGQITSIPPEIGLLTNLTTLELRCGQITSLPNEILTLPSTCTIFLNAPNLSANITNNLRASISTDGYAGPIIHFNMRETTIREHQTTDQILNTLYNITGNPISSRFFRILRFFRISRFFPNISKNKELNSWLNRLSYMADFNPNSSKRIALTNKILQYLEKANSNEEFRHIFEGIINGASETCGDRMALSILYLGLNYQIAQTNLVDLNSLTRLLKGSWGLSLLENIAREKVKSLNFVDEIEVYLGYPVMLKKDLELPIDVDQMLYFRCSAITRDDLTNAKEFVKSHYNNNDAFVAYLITQDKWLEALYQKNPNLKDWRVNKQKKYTDDIDHAEEIENKFKEMLKGETLKIISDS